MSQQQNMLPVLNIIKNILTNGFEILEKTNEEIMNLPSVKNQKNDSLTEYKIDLPEYKIHDLKNKIEEISNKVFDLKRETENKNVTDKSNLLNKDDLKDIKYKIDKLEDKVESMFSFFDNILNKFTKLEEKFINLTNEKKSDKEKIIESAIISSCKNENIKLEIDEKTDVKKINIKENTEINWLKLKKDNDNDNEEKEEEEKEEEEEEEEEEDEEEEEEKEEEEEEEEEEDEEEEEEEEEKEEDKEEEIKILKKEDEVETEEESEEESEDESEEEELFEIEIDNITYCTTNEENGFIFELTKECEQGKKVGYLKNGDPIFY